MWGDGREDVELRAEPGPQTVDDIVLLAGISANTWTQRQAGLSPAELCLYRAILLAFPDQGGPPSLEWLYREAATLGVDAGAVLGTLEARDLLVCDSATGTITAAYPFSGLPTAHRGAQALYAMCAIDALGIALLLGRDAVVRSSDPTSGAPIRVENTAGEVRWHPPNAVVLVASRRRDGPLEQRCCAVINFFQSPDSVLTYQRRHPEIQGQVLAQADAMAVARHVFADLLTGVADAKQRTVTTSVPVVGAQPHAALIARGEAAGRAEARRRWGPGAYAVRGTTQRGCCVHLTVVRGDDVLARWRYGLDDRIEDDCS